MRAAPRQVAAEGLLFFLRRERLAACPVGLAGWRRRCAEDDVYPQRLVTAEQVQRQVVTRIECVENGREFFKQMDLAARRADDQILGLQAGPLGGSAATDAQDPHATAGLVVGKRAQINPLGGGNRRYRLAVRIANARFQSIQWALCRRGRCCAQPCRTQHHDPDAPMLFHVPRPFLKCPLSHTMEVIRPPMYVRLSSLTVNRTKSGWKA